MYGYETGISEDRILFLKKSFLSITILMLKPKRTKKDESLPDTYSVGVTDIVLIP